MENTKENKKLSTGDLLRELIFLIQDGLEGTKYFQDLYSQAQERLKVAA
jgi:hypothetical protein